MRRPVRVLEAEDDAAPALADERIGLHEHGVVDVGLEEAREDLDPVRALVEPPLERRQAGTLARVTQRHEPEQPLRVALREEPAVVRAAPEGLAPGRLDLHVVRHVPAVVGDEKGLLDARVIHLRDEQVARSLLPGVQLAPVLDEARLRRKRPVEGVGLRVDRRDPGGVGHSISNPRSS